jgi:hypothetical protein
MKVLKRTSILRDLMFYATAALELNHSRNTNLHSEEHNVCLGSRRTGVYLGCGYDENFDVISLNNRSAGHQSQDFMGLGVAEKESCQMGSSRKAFLIISAQKFVKAEIMRKLSILQFSMN